MHSIFTLKIPSESEQNLHFLFCSEMLLELSRREKAANIIPDPDLDLYMKVRQHSWRFGEKH